MGSIPTFRHEPNLVFPGSALLWRKQAFQGMGYLLAFAIPNAFRHDIGAVWAIIPWRFAQVHFHKIRKPASAHDFGRVGKTVIWLCAVSVLVLYSLMYGPSWTHAGEIKYPLLLYTLVVASLILPAILVTFWLRARGAQNASTLEGGER